MSNHINLRSSQTSVPVFDVRRVLCPFPSDEQNGDGSRRHSWDVSHHALDCINYTEAELDDLVHACSEAQMKLKSMESSKGAEKAVVECRLQHSNSFNFQVRAAPHAERSLLSALASRLTTEEPMKVVGYSDRLLKGSGLIVCSKQLVWPQEKSMARFVLYTTQNDPVEQTAEEPMHHSWSSMMKHLCFSLPTEAHVPGFLSDFVSSVYLLLQDLVLFTDDDIMNAELARIIEIWNNDLMQHKLLGDVVSVLRSAISGDKREILFNVERTCSLLFLEACVVDSEASGSNMKDAVESALKASKAIHNLRVIRRLSDEEASRTYTRDDLFFLPHTSNSVDLYLQLLQQTLDSAEYDFMTLTSRTPPTAAVNLSAYPEVTEEEELNGSMFKVGNPSKTKTSRHEMMKAKKLIGKHTVTCTAVIARSGLRCTVSTLLPSGLRRTYRALRRSITSIPAGPAGAVGVNADSEDSADCIYVINEFLSGEFGKQAARWALDRIIEGQIKVSKNSESGIKHCVETYADGPGVLRINANICSLTLQEHPILYHQRTKTARLVLDEKLEPQVLQYDNGMYMIMRRETNVVLDTTEWKKCALKDAFQLA